MGGCIGINRRGRSGNDNSSENVSRPTSGSTRKNHLLCHETIRWRSDVPLTEGQLRSKRDEFWETAPAFEGRKEIWDALRAAAVAAESLDFQLAQAILDGACISVPNGFLTECYDELGTRYQVPVYCLSYPINIVKEDSGRDSPAETSEPVEGGTEIMLKLRLSSTCQDIKLPIFTTDTIGMAKKKLQGRLKGALGASYARYANALWRIKPNQYQEGLEPSKQRWFFGGKLLGDKLHIEDAKILPGYVVQVIVNAENTS